ncbi:uncharacterized protein LOC120335021 [Styela clava]
MYRQILILTLVLFVCISDGLRNREFGVQNENDYNDEEDLRLQENDYDTPYATNYNSRYYGHRRSHNNGLKCSKTSGYHKCRSYRVRHLSSATCRLLGSIIVLNEDFETRRCVKYCCPRLPLLVRHHKPGATITNSVTATSTKHDPTNTIPIPANITKVNENTSIEKRITTTKPTSPTPKKKNSDDKSRISSHKSLENANVEDGNLEKDLLAILQKTKDTMTENPSSEEDILVEQLRKLT